MSRVFELSVAVYFHAQSVVNSQNGNHAEADLSLSPSLPLSLSPSLPLTLSPSLGGHRTSGAVHN